MLPFFSLTKQSVIFLDETDADGLRAKLMSMAASALKAEAKGETGLETLLERQDWLDQLRRVRTL